MSLEAVLGLICQAPMPGIDRRCGRVPQRGDHRDDWQIEDYGGGVHIVRCPQHALVWGDAVEYAADRHLPTPPPLSPWQVFMSEQRVLGELAVRDLANAALERLGIPRGGSWLDVSEQRRDRVSAQRRNIATRRRRQLESSR